MTEEDNVSPDAECNPKDSSNKVKDKKDRGRSFTKIVCRRLPPSMTEETFLEQIAPIPEYDYFYFAKPDLSLTPDLFSRAYINFVNVEDIFIFRDKFDDYIFLDEKGNEFPAIVEYAPFQRIPKKRRKKDPKSGLLENDSTFLEYLESLKETDSDCREPKMEYSFQLTEEKKETTTPLLEFLATRRREEKRRKEERQKRRIRNRNPKEEDVIEEDVKKIKPRDAEKLKEPSKSVNKRKDDETINSKPQQSDSKEKNITRGNKSYRESRKPEDSRKRTENEKKDHRSKNVDNGEVKLNRKERRERQREAAATKMLDKGKDVKKLSESKKDNADVAQGSFRQMDETEQDDILSFTIESKSSPKAAETSPKEIENPKAAKSLVSSNIKPFTQLPKYKIEDLTKVIDGMDKGVIRKKTDDDELSSNDTQEVLDQKPEEKNITEQDTEDCAKKYESSVSQQRRNSLESSEIKTASDESLLRRHKSLDDKSQENSSEREGSDREKTSDHKKERRLRNKDRPSIVIYQPGMGKFSKQRMDRNTKDNSSDSNQSVK